MPTIRISVSQEAMLNLCAKITSGNRASKKGANGIRINIRWQRGGQDKQEQQLLFYILRISLNLNEYVVYVQPILRKDLQSFKITYESYLSIQSGKHCSLSDFSWLIPQFGGEHQSPVILDHILFFIFSVFAECSLLCFLS